MSPQAQEQVARAFVQSSSGLEWSLLRGRYVSLAGWGVLRALYVGADGTEARVPGARFGFDWKYLKDAMTDQHGSWFSSTLEITPDGSYEFGFNHDSLEPLAWCDDEIVDETWINDLILYPRPWAEIPDWHVVRRDFTEESWAARVAQGL